MLILYIGSIVISLILVFVAFLLSMGIMKEEEFGSEELKEFFSNNYYISALAICVLVISLIPIINILGAIIALYEFIDYYFL